MEFVPILCLLAGAACVWFGLRFICGKRGEPTREWVEVRVRHRHLQAVPSARPIEAVVADVRRRGARFHGLHPRTSYAKVQAVRSAYDRALAECCASLGLTHLLAVLPAGPELDAERKRVEGLIGLSGVDLPYVA